MGEPRWSDSSRSDASMSMGVGTIRGIAKKLGIRRRLLVLVHEGSRNVWGLRVRRTEQRLALSPLVHVVFRAFIRRRGPGCTFCREHETSGEGTNNPDQTLERIEEHET